MALFAAVDLRPSEMDLGDASSARSVSSLLILVMQTRIDELQAEIASLQTSLEREQRLRALHQQTLATQSYAILELQELLDVHRLDPNEQSQSLRDLPDSLPSTQALLDSGLEVQGGCREEQLRTCPALFVSSSTLLPVQSRFARPSTATATSPRSSRPRRATITEYAHHSALSDLRRPTTSHNTLVLFHVRIVRHVHHVCVRVHVNINVLRPKLEKLLRHDAARQLGAHRARLPISQRLERVSAAQHHVPDKLRDGAHRTLPGATPRSIFRSSRSPGFTAICTYGPFSRGRHSSRCVRFAFRGPGHYRHGAVGTLTVTTRARFGIKLLAFKPFNPAGKRAEITYREEAVGHLTRPTKDGGGFELIGLLPICDPPSTDTEQTFDDAILLGVKIKMIFSYAVAYGSYLTLSTITLVTICIKFGVLFEGGATIATNHSDRILHSVVYLQVATISQALIFVTRSHSFFMERPSAALFCAFCIAQLVPTIIAAYADWGFTSTHGISGGWVGIVWIWDIVWFVPLDWIKLTMKATIVKSPPAGETNISILRNRSVKPEEL
ncbi:uncharacterized protein B0H18DRAFT_1113841 [Fomitopsis serialis]|uniref:uncharacterized protein n=1 Tax=Fomitopsis serialis TaxID=139415 RepID=UPI0020076FAA|nr:uncharacterized protein B0H18DRAFT_1113841 [Neoantrodia serialis]KAH9936456.1 hypothetical protein B0H18DRAFT_1113841 [Neoantrodia serialis]